MQLHRPKRQPIKSDHAGVWSAELLPSFSRQKIKKHPKRSCLRPGEQRREQHDGEDAVPVFHQRPVRGCGKREDLRHHQPQRRLGESRQQPLDGQRLLACHRSLSPLPPPSPPSSRQVICKVSYASVGDVDRAVAAAKEAYDNGPWGKMNPRDRGSLLYK